MATAEPGQLEFRGDDAAECEAFINAVARQALTTGKQRDDHWVADFASSCFTQKSLRWWDRLDDETQGSWKLLRKAMLSRYRPLFYGKNGEEAEEFVQMVRERALDEGKQNNNSWVIEFATACFAGEALRWHASLDPAIQNDWAALQQAIFAQYPRTRQEAAADLIPTPAAAVLGTIVTSGLRVTKKRGLIGIIREGRVGTRYLNKNFSAKGFFELIESKADALMVEWNWPSDELQVLLIVDDHRSGCDVMGVQWQGRLEEPLNYASPCPVNSKTGKGSGLFGHEGPFGLSRWKISQPSLGDSGTFSLELLDENGYIYPSARIDFFTFDTSPNRCKLILESV